MTFIHLSTIYILQEAASHSIFLPNFSKLSAQTLLIMHALFFHFIGTLESKKYRAFLKISICQTWFSKNLLLTAFLWVAVNINNLQSTNFILQQDNEHYVIQWLTRFDQEFEILSSILTTAVPPPLLTTQSVSGYARSLLDVININN